MAKTIKAQQKRAPKRRFTAKQTAEPTVGKKAESQPNPAPRDWRTLATPEQPARLRDLAAEKAALLPTVEVGQMKDLQKRSLGDLLPLMLTHDTDCPLHVALIAAMVDELALLGALIAHTDGSYNDEIERYVLRMQYRAEVGAEIATRLNAAQKEALS